MVVSKHSLFLSTCGLLLLAPLVLSQDKGVGVEKGIDHCKKCGNITSTGLKNANISRCVLFERDPRDITNSYFKCECLKGFNGTGLICEDYDECAANKDNDCDANAKCINTVGSYNCSCKPGWSEDGKTCKDINECEKARQENKTICSYNGNCTNTQGSYTCECAKGFKINSQTNDCIDINECANSSRCEQQCTNYIGGYQCSCYPGFEEDDPKKGGVGCKPFKQCERLPDLCGDNTHCVDIDEGGYYCECKKGFKWEDGPFKRHCVDINECDGSNPPNCTAYPNTECHNTYGSVECACKEGYTGPKENCENINECTMSNDCDANADCTDGVGNYTCTCRKGFSGNGTVCEDIDECKRISANICHKYADCTNTKGNYTCQCIYGFEGDGYNCTEKKVNGKTLKEEKKRIDNSRLIAEIQLLDHDRLQLALEHERLLRICEMNELEKRKNRFRRAVIDVSPKTAENAQVWIVTLKKIIGDLTLENHALRIGCAKEDMSANN